MSGKKNSKMAAVMADSITKIPMVRVMLRESGESYECNPITQPADVVALLRPMLECCPVEEFIVLAMNAKGHPLCVHRAHIGGVSCCMVDPTSVFRFALLAGAASIIVSHNHPSGDPTPSPEDHQITKKLVEIGKMLDIQVLDHVIIGRPGTYSFRGNGQI